MNIQRQNWLLSRRHFLRGAGVTLALPFLDCMRPLRAAAADKLLTPKRSVFIYLPNGVNTDAYQILEAGAGYQFSQPLAALEKHRAVITPFSGLHHPNAAGINHGCRGNWLTGAKMGEGIRNTISVDQLMAQVTAPFTRFPSLELSNQNGSMSTNADGVGLPAQSDPGVAFREMFEEPQDGLAKQRRGLQRRGSILDTVLDEAQSLNGQLGSGDRGRLEQYLTTVRELEVRIRRSDKWLDTPRAKVDPATVTHLTHEVSLQLLGDHLRTMYDLIVLAFQTDVTRVATFSTGGEGVGHAVPEIGVMSDRHNLSHHNGDPELMAQLARSDAFHITQFSYFLDRLSEVKDADGSLLDTTMALYGSNMSHGHGHGMASVPTILAGGSGLGLKHGKHVDFNLTKDFVGYGKNNHYCYKPVNEKARLSNLLLTMAQKMEVKTEQFADSLEVISEVTV